MPADGTAVRAFMRGGIARKSIITFHGRSQRIHMAYGTVFLFLGKQTPSKYCWRVG